MLAASPICRKALMIRQSWAAGGFHLSIRQYRPWPVSWFIQLGSRCRDQARGANWQIGAAAISGTVVAALHVSSSTMGARTRTTGHPVEEGKPAPEPPRRRPKPAPHQPDCLLRFGLNADRRSGAGGDMPAQSRWYPFWEVSRNNRCQRDCMGAGGTC